VYHELPTHLSDDQISSLLKVANETDLRPGPGGSRIIPLGTEAQDLLLEILEGSWQRAMFVALYPSSQLVCHKDPAIPWTRIHIPIQVNEGCWSFHDGIWVQPVLGHLYEMNPAEPHGAVNWGSTLRIHLIVDK
jgi:hypothetical protein